MDAVPTKSLEPFDKTFASQIEILINVFQPGGGHGLDSNQGTFNAGSFHRLQKFDIFSRFHGDLREENHVVRKFSEAFHEFEALGTKTFEFAQPRLVVLLRGEFEIGKSDRVKVVIRKRDETKTETPQLHDLLHHYIGGALAGTLPICPPDGAERAVLGASSDSLYRRPHIALARNQIPPSLDELASFDASAHVDRLGNAGLTVR